MSYRIAIVGESWGPEDEKARESFVGASGKFLRAMLRAVGFDPRECYFTDIISARAQPTNNFLNFCGPKKEGIKLLAPVRPGKYIKQEHVHYIEDTLAEIERADPNLILCVGAIPASILSNTTIKIARSRGTIMFDRADRKLLPTYRPSAVLCEYSLRPVFMKDLYKAHRLSAAKEFVQTKRQLWIKPTLADIEQFYHTYIRPRASLPWGVDIETKQNTITEIGFARPDIGIVIPFSSRINKTGNYWPTADYERQAWEWVRKICGDLAFPVFQNGLYDINYLWRTVGIQVPHAGNDTMLLHHAIQPELRKGLGFLASIYTDEPEWKFMREKNSTLKREDD